VLRRGDRPHQPAPLLSRMHTAASRIIPSSPLCRGRLSGCWACGGPRRETGSPFGITGFFIGSLCLGSGEQPGKETDDAWTESGRAGDGAVGAVCRWFQEFLIARGYSPSAVRLRLCVGSCEPLAAGTEAGTGRVGWRACGGVPRRPSGQGVSVVGVVARMVFVRTFSALKFEWSCAYCAICVPPW
jgi:hypothetical protein